MRFNYFYIQVSLVYITIKIQASCEGNVKDYESRLVMKYWDVFFIFQSTCIPSSAYPEEEKKERRYNEKGTYTFIAMRLQKYKSIQEILDFLQWGDIFLM